MVFEPAAVPASHEGFLDWYALQTKWGEDHGYDDPAITSERLRAWLQEIVRIFPPMNGPLAKEKLNNEEEASSSDYAIGTNFIFASFAWSKSEAAYMTVARLAEKYGLGLFNASSTGEEVWTSEDGRMTLAHDKRRPSIADRVKSLLNLG